MNQEEWDIQLLEYWQEDTLSTQSKQDVEDWLGVKEENRLYFENLQREFLCQRWVLREGLIHQKGERRFQHVARKKAILHRIIPLAACVSFFVLSGIGYYLWNKEIKKVQLVENET